MKSFVEAYSSLMGGGKSFTAVKRMLEWVSFGGVVYSNIELKLDPWFNESYPEMKEFFLPECFPGCATEWKGAVELPRIVDVKGVRNFVYNSRGARHYLRTLRRGDQIGWELQDGQINYIPDESVGPQLMHNLPRGSVHKPVLVVLDEALDHFENSSANTNAEFRSFLRHCRKLGINLIFITQDFSALEKKIRSLTHFVWLMTDLHEWPVPVFGSAFKFFGLSKNGALPPPWSQNILTRQFHAKDYGLSTSKPVNSETWVYRDPGVFGCYQSVNLHNSNIQMSGVAKDFGSSGAIRKKKGKNKMNRFERIIIYTAIAASLYLSIQHPDPAVVSAPAVAVASAVPEKEVPPDPDDGFERNGEGEIVETAPLSWFSGNGEFSVFMDGVRMVPGLRTSRGIVDVVSLTAISFRDDKGARRWVYHVSPPAVADNPDRVGKKGLSAPL